jgi:hypothetical protein
MCLLTITRLDPSRIRDITPDVLDRNGGLRVLPAAYWATTTPVERALFGHRHGLYSFPTVELVEYLRKLIGGGSAIEIGASHGVLAEHLGIPATDSRQQEVPEYRDRIVAMGQCPVRYGRNVVACDAAEAVRRYRPDVVIGCWVTHRWEPSRCWAGGNEAGIDEDDVIGHCSRYVLVGNDLVHRGKKIWDRAHHIEYPSWLVSRAVNGNRDFIAVWPGPSC